MFNIASILNHNISNLLVGFAVKYYESMSFEFDIKHNRQINELLAWHWTCLWCSAFMMINIYRNLTDVDIQINVDCWFTRVWRGLGAVKFNTTNNTDKFNINSSTELRWINDSTLIVTNRRRLTNQTHNFEYLSGVRSRWFFFIEKTMWTAITSGIQVACDSTISQR